MHTKTKEQLLLVTASDGSCERTNACIHLQSVSPDEQHPARLHHAPLEMRGGREGSGLSCEAASLGVVHCFE